MTIIKKTYTVTNIKQLVDINGDITNFKADFSVKSLNNGTFDLLVIDQTTLDSGQNPEYKKVKGHISGSVSSDTNTYQNYFIILKADKPCDCEVVIDVVEVQPFSISENVEKFVPKTQQYKRVSNQDLHEDTGVSRKWKIILFVFFVIAVLVYLFSNRISIGKVGTKSRASSSVKAITPPEQTGFKFSDVDSALDKLMSEN